MAYREEQQVVLTIQWLNQFMANEGHHTTCKVALQNKTDIAVIKEQMFEYKNQMKKLEEKLDQNFQEIKELINGIQTTIKTDYATKQELSTFKAEMEPIKNNYNKIVGGLLLFLVIAVISLLIPS